MKRLPSMQTLRAFEAAARHENYSAAAHELGVTHGAVSHRIRELETQLGVTLFKRAGRAMTPSREAVTLLAQVREALGMLERALPGSSASTPGHLVIGVHPSLATRWLISRLGRFTRRYERATVEVRSTADLGDFLAQGTDVAIRYGGGTWPNAARERIAGEVLFPVCTPAYRDAHRLHKASDLARCRLLRHAWQPWAPWLRAARVRIAEPTDGLIRHAARGRRGRRRRGAGTQPVRARRPGERAAGAPVRGQRRGYVLVLRVVALGHAAEHARRGVSRLVARGTGHRACAAGGWTHQPEPPHQATGQGRAVRFIRSWWDFISLALARAGVASLLIIFFRSESRDTVT